MRIIGDHFRRYAHALRFAIGLHGAKKLHSIVKNKHYQISSGARASLDLDSLHRTYCMHMYGCELWDLNCKYVSDFKVAWRKIKRRILGAVI